MAKIRILALTKSTGGIAFYNKMLLAALDPDKFTSHTICLSENAGAYAAALAEAGLSAEAFPMARYRISPGGDARVLRQVLRRAREWQAGLILAHGSKPGVIGRAAGRLAGVPAIYVQASLPFLRRVQGRKAPLYWGLESAARGLGGTIVTLTGYARRETLAKRLAAPEAVRVIRTGIDTGRFRPQPELRAEAARALGLDPGRPIVGWMGRLEPQKAPLDYVAALRRVAPAHPEAQFVLAGEGSLQEEVRQALRDGGLQGNVRLVPWQDDPARAYQAMDIFAMSSHWEGLPLTLLEAMASGCVPVATTVDGCPEAAGGEDSGLLVPPGDPAAMAAALGGLLPDPERRRAMSAAARARVLELFDRRRMVREWEALFEEKAAAASPARAAPPRRKALRICMVISSYHPVVGGAERQLAQLAQLMQAEGHHLRIITRRYPGLAPQEVIGGIEVERVRCNGPKPLAATRFAAGAARAIRRFAPDAVHCHSMFSPALAGLLACGPAGRPLLVKPMCGGEAASVLGKPGGRLRGAALRRGASRFIAVSSEIEQELVQLGFDAGRILRIPNGVDTARFRPCRDGAERAALRLKLGLPGGTLFLFAGRLARQKRLPLLLEAWPQVRARCPDATLLVAGANRQTAPGHDADAGDAEAVPPGLLQQEGVRFLGHVEDMASCLRAADAFVLPSVREGLSNALLEAAASGLAIVASRVGGTEDLIADGISGRLFAPDDLAGLTRALIEVGSDGARRRALGAAAAAEVSRNFDIRHTAERLLLAYAALSGGRAAETAAAAGALPRGGGPEA